MAAGSDDRAVADLVALESGATPERALEPALAADVGAREHVRQLASDVGETAGGDVAGELQPREFPLVLDQPQLVEHLAETLTAAAWQQRVDSGVEHR